MYGMTFQPLSDRPDEVSEDVMVAAHYHACCCSRSLNVHVTAAVVHTAPQFCFVFLLSSLVFSVRFPLFLFADMLSDLNSLSTYYLVTSEFHSDCHKL